MTRALSTVENILRSEKSDLKTLASIAGLDPAVMYLNADLTGVDLRGQDVSFLVDLNTNFEGAILTGSQRSFLRSGRSREHKLQTIKSIRDARVTLIMEFIEKHLRSQVSTSHDQAVAFASSHLQQTLLQPIVGSTSSNPNNQFGSDYMSAALAGLPPPSALKNSQFYEDLFTLLGELQCPVDQNVRAVLSRLYVPTFDEEVGILISCMRPTPDLDVWWAIDTAKGKTRRKRAEQIASRRKIHPYAAERYLESSGSLDEMVSFLDKIAFDTDNDLAERLALHIVRNGWPPSETKFVLNSNLPPKIRNAVFRQLLSQGNERRIANVIDWLSDNPDAAGPLSLENAFFHIEDFDLAYSLAQQLAPFMRPNQWMVIDRAISGLAYRDEDRARLRRLGDMAGTLARSRSR